MDVSQNKSLENGLDKNQIPWYFKIEIILFRNNIHFLISHVFAVVLRCIAVFQLSNLF